MRLQTRFPAPLVLTIFFLVPNDAIYVPASHRLIQMRDAESKSAITHRRAKVNRRQFKLLAHAVSRLRLLSLEPETSIVPQKSICVAAIMFSNLFDSVVWMQRVWPCRFVICVLRTMWCKRSWVRFVAVLVKTYPVAREVNSSRFLLIHSFECCEPIK